MKKIFWEDPYITQLCTKVREVRDNKILPEETIIFSFSGGQESDKATINGVPVLNSEKIGEHIAEDKARIDFIYYQNISTLFQDLLADYNQIISSDLSIQTGYLDEVSKRRYWRIEGFSQVPCGGTHIKSTKEVGYVTLKRKNIGKGKERIEIRLLGK